MPVNRKRNKRALGYYLFWSVVALFAAGSLLALIINLPLWQIQFIDVAGTEILNGDQIRVLAGIPYHENLFLYNVKPAEALLAELPQVASIKILKILPNRILIRVKERTPFAVVSAQGQTMVISQNGFNLSYQGKDGSLLLNLPDTSLLPIVSGLSKKFFEGDRQLQDKYVVPMHTAIHQLSKNLPFRTLHLSFEDNDDLTLLIDDVLRVKLGQLREIKKKLAVFEVLYRNFKEQGRSPVYIDVCLPDDPAVKF